jgi:hypothetical protein
MKKSLQEEVSEAEVQSTLFSMKRGKILGPDGFIVDFFIIFYDLVKNELLIIVRESKKLGKMLGSFNVMFLRLIPKKKDGISFWNYRPISCFIVVYKIVTKVIARILKSILSELIVEEKFSFLQNHQICDVVIVVREFFHSIKKSNENVAILKLELSKACDI